MNDNIRISRRAFAGGALVVALGCKTALAQGFAGLGMSGQGFAPVTPGKTFAFPADHGPHPDYRIEWWYVTANLVDSAGVAYGAQWTLFRQAMAPGAQQEGWANQQIWMGHAAVTRADTHRYSETFARGGVGQAGVETRPFRAWIDSWEMRGSDRMREETIEPDGRSTEISSADNSMTPTAFTELEGRRIPTAWRIAIPSRSLTIECVPLNPRSWMGTSFPYWEGPISFKGSHSGLGYLEMTGY